MNTNLNLKKKLETFDIVIIVLSIIAIFFIIMYDNNDSNKICDTINDLSVGIICSSIFYFIVQWYPNYKKRETALSVNKIHIDNIILNLEYIFNLYSDNYFNNKSIDQLEKNDFLKIDINYDSFKEKKLNDYRAVNSFFEDIITNNQKIINNSHVNDLPKEIIILLNKINNNEIKIFFEFNQRNIAIDTFNKVLDIKNGNSKLHIQCILNYNDFSNDLHDLYTIYTKLKKVIY